MPPGTPQQPHDEKMPKLAKPRYEVWGTTRWGPCRARFTALRTSHRAQAVAEWRRLATRRRRAGFRVDAVFITDHHAEPAGHWLKCPTCSANAALIETHGNGPAFIDWHPPHKAPLTNRTPCAGSYAPVGASRTWQGATA